MTLAIILLEKEKIPHRLHQYTHGPKHPSYGREAVENFHVPPDRVFKTLVAVLDNSALVGAILAVQEHLNMKRLARAAKAKRAYG